MMNDPRLLENDNDYGTIFENAIDELEKMADKYAHDGETMAELVWIISLFRMGEISREIVLQDLQYHFLQYPILEIEFMRNLPPNMTQFSYMRTQFTAQEIADESDPRYGLSFGRTSNFIANFSSGLIVKNGRQYFLPQRNIENNGDNEDVQIPSQSSAFALYSTPRFLNNPFAKITDNMHICNRGSMDEDYKTCIIHGKYRTCAIHNSHRPFNNVPQNSINTFEASNSGAAFKTLNNIAITKDKRLSGVRIIHRIMNIIISHRCFGKILPSKINFDPRVLNTKSHNISRNRAVRPVPTFSKRKGSRNILNLKVIIPAANVNKIPKVADIKLKAKTSNTCITTSSNIQGVPSVSNVNVTNAVSDISTSIKASNISIVPSAFENITGTTFRKGVISSNINFTPITSNTNTTHLTANSSIYPTAPRDNVILTSTASHVSVVHTVSTASVSSSFQHSKLALTPTNISITPKPTNFNLAHSNVISSEAANHSVAPINLEIFGNPEIPSISIFPVSTRTSPVNDSCIAPIFTLTPINSGTNNVPSTSIVNRTPMVPNINMAATDKNIGDTSSASGIKFTVRRRGIYCPVSSAGRRRFDFHGGLRANKNNVDRRAYSESENLEEVVGPDAASESYEDNTDSVNTNNNVFIGGFEEESFSQPYLNLENVHNANANMRNIYARKLKGAYYNINHLKYGNRYVHKPISVLGTEMNKIGNNLHQCGACAACRYSSTSPIPLFTRQGSNCALLRRATYGPSNRASSREPNQVTNQSRRSHGSLRFQNGFGHRTNRNRCGRKLNYNPESSEDK